MKDYLGIVGLGISSAICICVSASLDEPSEWLQKCTILIMVLSGVIVHSTERKQLREKAGVLNG